jgi:hypothetical protein
MKRTWSEADIQYLRDNYPAKTHAQIALELGKKTDSVKQKSLKIGLKMTQSEKQKRLIAAALVANKGKMLTPEQDAIVAENYLDVPIKALARQFGVTKSAIKGSMNRQGLYLTEEIRKARRHFQSGKPAPNKGKKMSDMFTPDQIEKIKRNWFKKGNLPHNTREDGDIITRNDSRGVPQMYIRLSKGAWQYLSVYNYLQAHGTIQEGSCIVFRDGNTLNCDVSNLECISRQELMQRNSIARFPTELRSTIFLLSKLKKQIKNAEKQDN